MSYQFNAGIVPSPPYEGVRDLSEWLEMIYDGWVTSGWQVTVMSLCRHCDCCLSLCPKLRLGTTYRSVDAPQHWRSSSKRNYARQIGLIEVVTDSM